MRHQWKQITEKVTNERGIWPAQDRGRWKVDPTEGTDRMRIRLKLRPIPSPFLAPVPHESPTTAEEEEATIKYIPPGRVMLHYWQAHHISERISKRSPSSYTLDALVEEDTSLPSELLYHNHIKPGERILSYYKCSRITPFMKRDGEIVIGEGHSYFMEDHKSLPSSKHVELNPKNLTWNYHDIKEIHKRRYLLKNNALEIFLTNGKTYLLAFETQSERDSVYDKIMSLDLPNRVDYEYEVSGGMLKKSITKKWTSGLISNFEYLMHLNTLAGRSFNDLTQYPVFPFVCADYTSNEVDPNAATSFRDLSRPMGAQDEERLKKFKERYNQLVEMGEQPFHYGSHYSNVGSVLHFLVRLEPFTHYFIDFQGGRFDVPDRAFHSFKQSWLLSSQISTSDVKELIPEFFYLPLFLENRNRFDMGVKQDGERVNDVVLPAWAHKSARLFIKHHRDLLESKYVSQNLHHWIDLIFGYKQQGEEAVAAYNVFHPLTYEGGIDIDSITDQVMKEATIAQISSYGQTPKQLFKKPHPEKDIHAQAQLLADTVFSYPERLSPYPMWSTSFAVGQLALIDDTPIALGPNKVLIYPKAEQFISWGHWDQGLRICSLDTGKVLSVIDSFHDDDILCGDMTKDGTILATGGTAAVVKVWRHRAQKNKREQVHLKARLYGHSEPIQCVCVSQEWSVILSGSQDSTCILWDLNRLSSVRSLRCSEGGTVTAVAISPNTGDIVTVTESIKSGGGKTGQVYTLTLWSINGDALAKTTSVEKVLCVKFTAGPVGVARNVVGGGLQSGGLKIWDAWDLTLIKQLEGGGHKDPVTALSFSADWTQIISGDETGLVVCWSCKKPREMSQF